MCMRRCCLTRTATPSACVFVLQLLALALLAACKNDTASPAERNIEAAERTPPRATFGTEPGARVGDAHRERSSGAKPRPDSRRTRTQEPTTAVGNRDSVTSNVPSEKSDAERFLFYRAPGARVGDPGELRSAAREPQRPRSVSTISGLIYYWADTLLSHDADAHMSLYSPVLECSGSGANVSRDALRRGKERFIEALSKVQRFEIYDLRVRRTGNDAAVAEFRVEWAAGGSAAAAVWYRLLLHRARGQWSISCEEQSVPISRRGDR